VRKRSFTQGRTHRKGGFTLIEAVVALAILSLAMGALYQAFGWSLRRTVKQEQIEAGLLTAQSMLAELRGREFIRTGEDHGETEAGMRWSRMISEREARIDPQSPRRAFDVTIEVRWGSGAAQRIVLRSIETGRAAS
jgi:general secretion pathway protein I